MEDAKSGGKTDDNPQVQDVPATVNADTPSDNAHVDEEEKEKDGGKSSTFAVPASSMVSSEPASGSAAPAPFCASSTPPVGAVASSAPTVGAPSMSAFVMPAAHASSTPASSTAPAFGTAGNFDTTFPAAPFAFAKPTIAGAAFGPPPPAFGDPAPLWQGGGGAPAVAPGLAATPAAPAFGAPAAPALPKPQAQAQGQRKRGIRRSEVIDACTFHLLALS